MDARQEILDTIDIMLQKAMKDVVKIYRGNIVEVNNRNCVVKMGGQNYNVRFYGNDPEIGKVYPVFIPSGDMSLSFLISDAGISAEPSHKPVIGVDFNWTGGENTYQVLDDGDGNWRIKFLASGTFTPLKDMSINVFLVGAGGGGGMATSSYGRGAGGGGGFTATKTVTLSANAQYAIVVGKGGAGGYPGATENRNGANGGSTSAFGYSVAGGYGGSSGGYSSLPIGNGGNGGSGGGVGGNDVYASGKGGTDGGNGSPAKRDTGLEQGTPGMGQGTTTREFGETTGALYASGGNGGNAASTYSDANTGNGGDGGYLKDTSYAGADGIVCIRNSRT